MSQLECEKLYLGYENKTIVENLNFKINAGDYVCIVGENGSGKSTLVRTLLGLQPALSGDIKFSDKSEKLKIGYLPQQTDYQRDFPASVWEIVLTGRLSRKRSPFYNKTDKHFALKNIQKMGIEHLKNRCYRELSGGQQQRVLIARALCAADKILLLDEPTAGLDAIATDNIYTIISELNRDHKVTVIMVTHDIHFAVENATHILHLGDTAFYGTVNEFLTNGGCKLCLKHS